MMRILNIFLFISIAGMIIFSSCKKANSCEGCNNNKPPIAIAGPDQVITLPTDSISLDGSASNDPDGTISNWLWTKISGPASFNIVASSQPGTVIKNIVVGVYQFELKVTDNDGLSSKDTVQLTVNPFIPGNRPPVANTGIDQTITLPANTTTLDGSASTDPDNNITSYAWTKISGPASFNISNANAVQTQVTSLIEGVYLFELKVTDAGGLFSRDTTKINVQSAPLPPPSCDNSNRPLINAQLIPFGTLSIPRLGLSVASAGNKIVFAGAALSSVSGSPFPDYGATRVDIYDLITQGWSTAELSKKRSHMAAVSAGNKIFFAGGRLGDGAFDELFSTVDIYDVSTNTWSVAMLSQPRAFIAAAAAGNKVFFAGGEKDWDYQTSNVIDIYDMSSNTWSVHTLSEARAYISGVSTNNQVYFAGGHREDRWYANPSSRIDIYDNTSGTWSSSSLSQPMGSLAGIATDENIYWAPGCKIEIKNINTWNSSDAFLFKDGGWINSEGQNTVRKDNNIVFFRHDYLLGTDKFDIYNISTGVWSIGVLPQRIYGASIIAVNNTIYLAGGTVSGSFTNLSNKIFKLEF
jgi:hypothetical protein